MHHCKETRYHYKQTTDCLFSLTWGVLQERITTTNYGTATSPLKFKHPVFVNTIQSIFAATLGYIYLVITRKHAHDLPVFPSRDILYPLSLVAITSSLASPFGYASLSHVDYITFILGKSCKLLPVLFLHVVLYRRKYPLYKYGVVALVTAGVVVFTLFHESAGKKGKGNAQGSSAWGLLLLSVNLLFDGLTNSTQDQIYKAHKPYTGQQMMCSLNVLSTVLQAAYLLVQPYLQHSALGEVFGLNAAAKGELISALEFIRAHPSVGWDILAFAACGALGQVFICESCFSTKSGPIMEPILMTAVYTLSTFGSLFLVTVTVTRKMLTMILSVVWFGHKLTPMQWVGVALVFGGVGVEAQLSKREKQQKAVEGKKR